MVLLDPLRQMMTVLDVLNCGAAVHDRNGIILYANDRLCQMMGRDRQQLVGKSVRDFYGTNGDSAFIDEALARFGRRHDGESYLPRADGSRIPVVASSAPMPVPSPLEMVQVVTLIDITEQKSIEQRLKDNYNFIVQMSNTVLEQALDLKEHSQQLEERVRRRTAELHEANMDAIYMLAVASEAKDQDTGNHVRRIQCYSSALARQLGMSEADAEQIGHSAILHDVGKILIPDEILKKPGPLTPQERLAMQEHAPAGERILSSRNFFAKARQIARHHHENWDGSGYPDGAAGRQIAPEARIVHLVDVYDALTSPRVYKESWTDQRAADEIHRVSGRMFDPEMVHAFDALRAEGRLDHIRKTLCAPAHPGLSAMGNPAG